MTLRKEFIFTIVCDSCGAIHHKPDFQTALEARISAAAVGWKFRQGVAGRYGKGRRSTADACPNCELPKDGEK